MTKKKPLKRKIKVALKRKSKIFKRSITKKKDLISKKFNTSIKGKKIDMVFISCTSIKFIDFVPQLEKLIGIPVTTSNHAMAWHCMRLGGVKNTLPNLGQLFLK